ncbi:hypothetical protein ACFLYR_08905 [Chloroflexota bacterium]
MVFTEQDMKQLLQEALQQAKLKPDKGSATQQINMNRSVLKIPAQSPQKYHSCMMCRYSSFLDSAYCLLLPTAVLTILPQPPTTFHTEKS